MARPIRFTAGTYRRAHKRARDVEHELWCDALGTRSSAALHAYRLQLQHTKAIRRRARREGRALFEGWDA